MKTALLLSGGMDSLCIAWWKRPNIAITIDYGQLAAAAEIDAASAICRRLEILHYVIRADLRDLGSGDLAGKSAIDIAPETDWWPYRNQLIVTLAAMRAVALGVTNLWLGVVQNDCYHRDGTNEFVCGLNALMAAQEGFISVEAPAINLTTWELICETKIPLTLLAWAHSCQKSEVTCGNCRGCNKYFEIMNLLANPESAT